MHPINVAKVIHAHSKSNLIWGFVQISDLKIHLQTTDYGNFLANQTNPLTVSKIDTEMRKKLCREFEYFRNHSLDPLSTFFTYMT